MKPIVSRLKLLSVCTLLVACSSCSHSKWPPFDESRMSLVLVAGEFIDVHRLDAVPCNFDLEEHSPDVIEDCFSGKPSVSTLHVYDVVHGDIKGRQLRVAYHPMIGEPPNPPGDGEPLLVLMQFDGTHLVLTHERQRIARTTSGEWAMPLYWESQLTILPCGARPLIKRLWFANPMPSEVFEEDAAEELRNSPYGTLRNGRFYPTHGVLLRDMKQFLAGGAPSPDKYYCADYMAAGRN